MDDWERLLDSISFGENSIVNHLLSLASIVNLLISAIFGILILLVYLKTNKNVKKNKIFIISIPVVTILMTMLMKMHGGSAIVFFGIFGVLSIIRFRSATPQSDISFILFSVIIGVLIGIGDYVLVILGFLVITAIIVLINFIFNKTFDNYALIIFKSGLIMNEFQMIIEQFLNSQNIKFKLSRLEAKTEVNDNGENIDKNVIEYEILNNSIADLLQKFDLIKEYMRDKNIRLILVKDIIEK